MSEGNGQKPEWMERLDRVEASHVRLMTDHELFVAEHEKFVAEQDKAWERYQAFVAGQEKEWERQKERWAALDERIDKLISGMGAFMRGEKQG